MMLTWPILIAFLLVGVLDVSTAQDCTNKEDDKIHAACTPTTDPAAATVQGCTNKEDGKVSCTSTTDPADKYKSGTHDVEDIRKAEKKITRAEDLREDFQLVSTSYLNCFTMLHTAPMTVAVLGHLMLVTLHKDVPLHSPSGGFQYIKYPESLRASTLQLANAGWSAFNLAEKNMDQIRLYTGQIPNYVKTAIKIFLRGTEQEIARILPEHLKVIGKVAKTCMEHARTVENAFMSVQDLAQELQETCMLTQAINEKEIQDGIRESKKMVRKIDASAKAEREIFEEKTDMKQKVQEAKDDYKQEKESMPGATKLIFMSLADSLTNVIRQPMNTLADFFKSTPEQQDYHKGFEIFLSHITDATEQLRNYLKTEGGDGDEIGKIKKMFEDQFSLVNDYTGPGKERLEGIYEAAFVIFSTLRNTEKGTESGELKEDMSKLQNLIDVAQLFSKTLYEGMPVSGMGPKMSSVPATGPFDTYVRQAYYRVETAELVLEKAKADYQKMNEKLEKERHNSQVLLDELSEVKLDQIDLNEIREKTQRCLKALGDIREQWGKLVRFFQRLSNVIESAMGDNFNLFIESMKLKPDRSLPMRFSDAMIDIMYFQTAEANKIAFMTSDIADMYLEISHQHLIGPLAQIGKLLALDPEKDKNRIKEKQKELTEECSKSTKAIGGSIEKRNGEFERRIVRRIDNIKKEMKAMLPPKPDEYPTLATIKNAIEEASELRQKREDEDLDYYT